MRNIDLGVIHCSDTPPGAWFDENDIRSWHTTPKKDGGRGWRDIGYHLVILLDGSVKEGRPFEEMGAHVRGHNDNSIGICLIGSKGQHTSAQWNSLLHVMIDLNYMFPGIKFKGHCELDSKKTCPDFDVQLFIKHLPKDI